jgi:uncharacterized membrane protein
MMNTFIGIFDNPRDARRAMEMLRDSGIALDDLSMLSRATEGGVTVRSADDVSASEGATVGAVWGGLVGLASLVIPGIGPIVAGGALSAALTGALTGAVTGAVVGGITAALVDFGGISEEEARGYEEQIRAGKTLVAVKAPAEEARHIRRMMTKANAEAVQVALYDERGQRVEQEREAPEM